jgi:hypothetical protein
MNACKIFSTELLPTDKGKKRILPTHSSDLTPEEKKIGEKKKSEHKE